MKDYLLITHTDLDGISPIILMNLIEADFEYKSVDIKDLDQTFDELYETEEIKNYKNIYVVDLSLTKHIYNLLKEHEQNNILVFDHHATHLFANEYPFVTVAVELNGRKTCGTELFYNHLVKTNKILEKSNIKDYVELVRQKDVYEFTSEKPKELEMLLNVYGKKDFVKSITKRLKKDKEILEFTAFEKRYLKITTESRERYIASRELRMKKYKIKGLTCGGLFAERYKDDIGNILSLNNPDLDCIIVINFAGGISYRTTRDDVNLSEFAAYFGGGGHVKASGSSMTDEFKDNIIKLYFEDAEQIIEEEKIIEEA